MNPEIVANFHKWVKSVHPDKIQFNPTVIEIKDGKIIFGMYKHMGRFSVSVEKINLDLKKQGIYIKQLKKILVCNLCVLCV